MKKIPLIVIAFAILTLTSVCYAANWQQATTITGSASQTTNYFTIPTGEWAISWSITPTAGAGASDTVFSAFIYPRGEDVHFVDYIMKLSGSQTSGVTYIHEGNKQYYLKITAANIQTYSLNIQYYAEATDTQSTSPGDPNYLLTVIIIALISFAAASILVTLHFRRRKAQQQQQSTDTLKDPKTTDQKKEVSVLKINFGKSSFEVGPLGVIALILALPAGLLIGFGLLDNFLYFLIGAPLLTIVLVTIYADSLQNQKKNKQNSNA